MSRIPLITAVTGINDKLPATRLAYDRETGVTDLSAAVDVTVDESGGVGRRAGQTQLIAGSYKSVWFDGGSCFAVLDRAAEYDDSAIRMVNSDLSTTGVRSGLTKSLPVYFCRIGEKTLYGNGVENGVITAGISAAWPDESVHQGMETTRIFYAAPLGTIIAYFQGRVWIAVGTTIYVSELYTIGKFRKTSMSFQFPGTVVLIRPVAGGVWVSDGITTGFIAAAEKFRNMRYVHRTQVPAHALSVNDSLVDLSNTALGIQDPCGMWSSDDGLMVGTADGQLINVTDKKLDYESGTSGATMFANDVAINYVY